MINQAMYALGAAPNKIREMFAYGLERKAQIGAENVFDLSIGNPNVPTPPEVKDILERLLERDPIALHAYTPSPGAMSSRQAVADHIKAHWGIDAKASSVYFTPGAAAALAICIQAVLEPGDELITVSPYFPEYKTWAENAQGTLIEVPARESDFQMDVPAIEAAITPRTSAIVINTPNNPVGAVYSRENLEELAAMLTRKEAELGRQLFIISDEPYRYITYGAEVPYVPLIYPRTLVCYSFSKSLSMPGERIGYIYVSDLMENAAEVFTAVSGAGRSLGYICMSSLFQYLAEECLELPSDVEAYRTNRDILTQGLGELGYEYIEPEGAFYLWVKALEPDAIAFSEQAKKHELLLVPSNSFGVPGWVRISYCVSRDVIERSLPAFAALKADYDA